MKDFIKIETKGKFVTEKFKVGSAYYIDNEKWEHGTVCLLTSNCSAALDFIYVNKFGNVQNFTLRPNDFIDDDYTITEAIFKVDIPEVKIISEWKTIKEAFATPGYFNNGDCYEIRTESQIGLFQRTVKGFLSEYYPTSERLRFVLYNDDTNVAAIRRCIKYMNEEDKPYEIIESSITNGMVIDIIVPDTTDNLKIRRLN